MKTIYLIALNTFKETIRNKVLYNILFFALGIIFLSISFGEWSVFARTQVMEDFGLATMSIAGLLLAVFIGVGMLGREISTRTLYSVLVKPIGRWKFVAGKWMGLLATLFINFSIMTAVFWIVIWAMGGHTGGALLKAVLLIGVEMAVIVSAAILFSSITTPTLGAIFTFGFYIIGHYNDLLEFEIVKARSPLFAHALKAIYFLLPNLEHFNIRTRIVYGLGVDTAYVIWAVLYGCLFSALFLYIACLFFNRKDL